MKLAICDDCRADRERLKEWIRKSQYCPQDAAFFEFDSAEKLLQGYELFDAVFLDIQMEGMDGSEAGERIRETDPDVMLLFYTGVDMNASRIFKSRPQGYLMKDMTDQDMADSLDRILLELSGREGERLAVTGDGKAYMVKLSDIKYISISGKGSRVWLTEQEARRLGAADQMEDEYGIQSPVKLREYYKKLKDHGFIYASKSYIINAYHVERIEKESVWLSGGTELSISRSCKKGFDCEIGHYWDIQYRRRGRNSES